MAVSAVYKLSEKSTIKGRIWSYVAFHIEQQEAESPQQRAISGDHCEQLQQWQAIQHPGQAAVVSDARGGHICSRANEDFYLVS